MNVTVSRPAYRTGGILWAKVTKPQYLDGYGVLPKDPMKYAFVNEGSESNQAVQGRLGMRRGACANLAVQL